MTVPWADTHLGMELARLNLGGSRLLRRRRHRATLPKHIRHLAFVPGLKPIVWCLLLLENRIGRLDLDMVHPLWLPQEVWLEVIRHMAQGRANHRPATAGSAGALCG